MTRWVNFRKNQLHELQLSDYNVFRSIFAQEFKFLVEKIYSQEKIRKGRLFKKVQAFCEEKVLRYPLGVFGMLNHQTNVGKLKNGVFTI